MGVENHHLKGLIVFKGQTMKHKTLAEAMINHQKRVLIHQRVRKQIQGLFVMKPKEFLTYDEALLEIITGQLFNK